jgi:hypothetical protein
MKHRNNIITTTIVSALGLFALLPIARAVSPPPDGGYPGGNTAEGQSALLGLTTGTYNTAIGFDSLLSLGTGSLCTGVGAGTLLVNTGSYNTATGAGSLLSNTTGGDNTADGVFALFGNTTGQDNTADGAFTLQYNTQGSDNTAIGHQTLQDNNTGSRNTAIGESALFENTASNDNTAAGYDALELNVSSGGNTAIGSGALSGNTTGSNNTALGFQAGLNATTGSNNVYIGAGINGVTGESNACRIASIFGEAITNGSQMFVNADNRLGTSTSSKRFKQNITPTSKASDVLYELRPVTFQYKKEIDPTGKRQFGLVAEDVEKVNPDLVVHDKGGKPYSVRYDQVNAMLLNEFLKEHRTMQQQQNEIDALKAELKEQGSLIRKVSAQLELNNRAPKTVSNSH